MADVLSASPLLDPSRPAKIPLILGSDLTRSASTADQRNVSIQWNYKPPPQFIQSAKVRRSGRASDTRVSLTCKDSNAQGEFQYTGTQQPSGSYALIYHPSTKSLVLEKLDVDFNFNLQTTPSNHDRSQVTSQYPQLDTGISDPESDDGSTTEAPAVEGIDVSEADANNPYDYRHFLKRRRTPSPEAPRVRSSVSPAVPPRRLSRSTTKPKPRPRPQQRPPKRSAHEEANANSGDSDDGGLTIEMGDDPKRRRFGSGAVVFNHDRRNGPISLRSAASSMSPASIRQESGNEEAESDNDVEQLELPSPRTRTSHETDQAVQDEDDDELVEDLMQAMESQEEDGAADGRVQNEGQTIQRTIEESSSESEEE